MNKSLILAAILATASVNAYATGTPENPGKSTKITKGGSARQAQQQGQTQQATGGSSTAAGGTASGTASGTATNAGNTQTYAYTSNDVVQHRNTPDLGSIINSPTANCRVTHGGGVVMAGFGGNYGSSTLDEGCHIIEVSKHLHNLGRARASILAMCQDAVARQALGAECPELQTTKVATETTAEVVKP